MDRKFKFHLQGGIEPYAPDCYWCMVIGTYGGFPAYDFDGWTINGVDFLSNYQSIALSMGVNASLNTNGSAVFDVQEICFWYMGNSDMGMIFDIRNSKGGQVLYEWQQVCEKTCWQNYYSKPDTYIFTCYFFPFISLITPNQTAGFGAIDFSNPASALQLQTYLQQFQPNPSVSVLDDGEGNFFVDIKNVYFPVGFAPVMDNNMGTNTFYQIPC